MSVTIQSFYHEPTGTFSYVVYEKNNKHAVVIDSVLDFDMSSGKISTEFVDQQLKFIHDHDLTIDWVLETHAHADHLCAGSYLRYKLDAPLGIGSGIKAVQENFKKIFNISNQELRSNGDVFNHLFEDRETFFFGNTQVTVISVPGHTRDCLAYLIENNAFIGDTLFAPDSGTARCDFPEGNSGVLFDSVMKLYGLPEGTILWFCHDYPKNRERISHVKLTDSKLNNI